MTVLPAYNLRKVFSKEKKTVDELFPSIDLHTSYNASNKTPCCPVFKWNYASLNLCKHPSIFSENNIFELFTLKEIAGMDPPIKDAFI